MFFLVDFILTCIKLLFIMEKEKVEVRLVNAKESKEKSSIKVNQRRRLKHKIKDEKPSKKMKRDWSPVIKPGGSNGGKDTLKYHIKQKEWLEDMVFCKKSDHGKFDDIFEDKPELLADVKLPLLDASFECAPNSSSDRKKKTKTKNHHYCVSPLPQSSCDDDRFVAEEPKEETPVNKSKKKLYTEQWHFGKNMKNLKVGKCVTDNILYTVPRNAEKEKCRKNSAKKLCEILQKCDKSRKKDKIVEDSFDPEELITDMYFTDSDSSDE